MIGRLCMAQRMLPQMRRAMATGAAKQVKLKVDGKEVAVPEGTMLVEAIRMSGSSVPTMCYHPDVPGSGGICRICLVESFARPGVPIVSCKTPVSEGMDINTMGEKTREYRRSNTAMMFATHPNTCNTCPANTKCDGQALNAKMNTGEKELGSICPTNDSGIFDHSSAIYRDMDRCINCDICVHTCKMQGVGALAFYNKDGHAVESMGPLDLSECIQCGQCINRCPTGALTEKPEISKVLKALKDPNKHVIFNMAPAIRVSIAEEFGCKAGERILKNELVTALKALGPNVTVFDTNFTADLTIMEEGFELIERLYRNLTGKKSLGDEMMPIEIPMFTSCCPGWVLYMEKNYPDMLKHLSTTKSPMQMLGSVAKSYWAKEVKKIDSKNLVNVAIMPCTAKKQEKDRTDMKMDDGTNVTDYVLTTRELGKLLRQANLDPTKMDKTPFDNVMGDSTGAAVIFGATGGVMEAALRTAYEVITGREIPFKNLDVLPVRGMEGIREAEIKLEKVLPKYAPFEGVTVKVAVAHGIQNAKTIVEIVKKAKAEGKPAPWHFIEVMACPGGCIGGGGQPKPTSMEIRKERTRLIFEEDKNLPLRKSHENKEVQELYAKFLHEPLGHNSHHYLHRTYMDRNIRNLDSFIPYESIGVENVLKKYPREQQYLLPIIVDECDRRGYISDPSLIKIANHLGMYPGQVDSVLSSYHYFPRKFTSDTHVYLCKCHSCMMKGQDKVIQKIQDKYGLSSINGGVSKDGRLTFHTLNWLGWCVNEGPACMVKRTGTDYIELLQDLNDVSINRFDDLNSPNATLRDPRHLIHEISAKRQKGVHSFMDNRVRLDKTVKKAVKSNPRKVIKEIVDSDLVGRGGAGFRTGLKWTSALEASSSEKYVVCNADEGLPSTYKDWCILRDSARRKEVLAGMGICAKTIGAKTCFMYLRYEYRNLVPGIEADIKELKKTCPQLEDLTFEIRLGGGPYVAGEENAQFESIEGKAPLPRKDRPSNVFPTVSGLFNKPTVINNVETFWAVPHILEQGSKPFKNYGLPKLLSISGDVEKPVLLESSLKSYTMQNVLDEIKAANVAAAEIGGNTEPIIFNDKFGMGLGFGQGVLNAVGSIVLFNSSRDLLDIYERKLHFMEEESCKQCVPCRDGSKLLHQVFHDLRNKATFNLKSIQETAESISASSICAHGKAIYPLFQEAIKYFNSKSS